MKKKTSKLLMEYKKFYLLIIVCLFSIGIFAQSGTEKISITFKRSYGKSREGFGVFVLL
jgi:hypothetical protein